MKETEQAPRSKKKMLLSAAAASTIVIALVLAVGITRNAVPTDLPPNPFVSPQSMLSAALTQLGRKGSIDVYKVTFTVGSDEDETLQENRIYLVSVPNDAAIETVPMDMALTTMGQPSNTDYYGYKYVNPDAATEKANAAAPMFSQRFPGQFFASAKARQQDAMHGNTLASFENANSIAFLGTNNASSAVRLQKNTLYVFVVNEQMGSLFDILPNAVCGDGWKMGSEACDDGNVMSMDGCSVSCVVEPNYTCTGSPSVCTLQAFCGDNVRQDPEQCDRGNQNGMLGSGCKSDCTLEIPTPF